MSRKLWLVILCSWITVVWASEPTQRTQLPSIPDQMRNERLDQKSVAGISPRASTELIALFFSEGASGSEVTIATNPFRLANKKADTFSGYRDMAWWLRNVQLAFTAPAKDVDGGNLHLELKWGLYRKAHRWDEHWDSYFPPVAFPEHLENVTDEWLWQQQEMLNLASLQVDSLLAKEGNDGISFSLDADRVKEKWEQIAFTIIGSHHLGRWLMTANGTATDSSKTVKGELAGQISRELWPDRWKNGGMTATLSGTVKGVIYSPNIPLQGVQWSATVSVGFPVLEQARFLLAYSFSKNENRILSGISYQFFPNPK